jgi:hypothetical protein
MAGDWIYSSKKHNKTHQNLCFCHYFSQCTYPREMLYKLDPILILSSWGYIHLIKKSSSKILNLIVSFKHFRLRYLKLH